MKNFNDTIVYYVETVQMLNQEIVDRFGDVTDEILFTLETDGYNANIKVNNNTLWSNTDEEREWIEEDDDYEDLCSFLKKQYNKLSNKFNKFSF